MQRPKKESIYEADHWEGYDPNYKASRRKFSSNGGGGSPNELFVTPPPPPSKQRFRPRGPEEVAVAAAVEEEEATRVSSPVIPGSYRTKARKVLPGAREQDLKRKGERGCVCAD